MSQQPRARRKISLYDRFVRARSLVRNWDRRLFVSPLEIRFVRVMRGHVLTIPFIKSRRTGFRLTFIWRGKILKRELVRHQVRAGKLYIDFGVVTPFYKRGIELYSNAWHDDIVRDQERETYLQTLGWQIMYVTYKQMNDPRRLYAAVARFLKS